MLGPKSEIGGLGGILRMRLLIHAFRCQRRVEARNFAPLLGYSKEFWVVNISGNYMTSLQSRVKLISLAKLNS